MQKCFHHTNIPDMQQQTKPNSQLQLLQLLARTVSLKQIAFDFVRSLDKTELLFLGRFPGKVSSHPWLLHHHWELCGVPGSDCKDLECDTGWPAVLHYQHCCDCTLLQIRSPQHQEVTSIPHPGGSTGSGPGSCHFTPRLLQLAPGSCACMCHPTSAAHPECSSPAGLQPKFSHPIPLLHSMHWLLVAVRTLFKTCCKWFIPFLHPRHGQTINPVLSTMLCYCQTACSSLTGGATAQQITARTSVSWLHNDGTSSPLTSGQKKLKCSTWSSSAYLMKLMYLHDSCSSWVVAPWLKALNKYNVIT